MDDEEADRLVSQIVENWREAPLSDIDKVLCAFAEKVTQTPHEMGRDDIMLLRDLGLSDRAIHDATQVISYFNYINRIADSLGVENETFIQEWEKNH